MNTHNRISYKLLMRLFCLILSSCLLWGCAGNQKAPSGDTAAETDITSEILETTLAERPDTEAARSEQMTFDSLCQEFFQDQALDSFLTLHYTLKNPEQYGITDYSIDFGEFSLDHLKEGQQRQNHLQEALAAIDPNLLTDAQKLTYRILTKALLYEDSFEGLELYYQALSPATGVQAQLPVLLTEYVFYDKEDIEHYLTLLSDIDRYYRQILDFEKQRADAGLFMSDDCVDQIVTECAAYMLASDHNLMVTGFDKRIDEMTSLTEEEKGDYKQRNITLVNEHFIPAYELLTDGLKALKGRGSNDQGLCHTPKGKDYYEYLVNSAIGTTCSNMDELQKRLEDQIDADLLAISRILKESPETADELAGYHFVESDPAKTLQFLEQAVKEDFPEISEYHYVTKYVPAELEQSLSPAFFLVPPIDSYNNCVIYINQGSSAAADALFPTLAHEGIPGHLYQNVYFLSNCDTPLRTILSFSGYSEGWATYVENYAYTIPGNGLSPELGQVLAHNASASLGIHALLDLNINYYGWDKKQAGEFLKNYFDISQSQVVDSLYHAVVNDPANYLTYYAGYLEIWRMRKLAEETLGDDFRLKEFHQFLLDIGPAPFTVIEPYFKTWLMTYHM